MIRLCAPSFGPEDRARIDEVLGSGMLVQGEMVAAFEAEISAALGVEAVACTNGTAALYLALIACDIGPGDDVIVPAFTWPSAANAVVRAGARPVFVDIDPQTLNLDVALLDGVLTPATRALVPIHQFGIPAPMHDVMSFAQTHGLRVIEDAACAIGVDTDAGKAGTVGDLGCFSFHPRKVITTGEGGAVVGTDAALVARVRSLRNHGQSPDGGLERFTEAGLNHRMPELSAAIGIGQMQRLDAIVSRRRSLAARYVRGLAEVANVRVPRGVQDPRGNAQSFVVDVRDGERRGVFMQRCAEAGIQTTIGTYAVVSQPFFRARGVDPADFPHAVAAMDRLMTLPLHDAMSDADVDRVVAQLAEISQTF